MVSVAPTHVVKQFGFYLTPVPDCACAVEEIEWTDDMALHQYARNNRRCGPPSCAYWHFIEPLFKRELTRSQSVGHRVIVVNPCRYLVFDNLTVKSNTKFSNPARAALFGCLMVVVHALLLTAAAMRTTIRVGIDEDALEEKGQKAGIELVAKMKVLGNQGSLDCMNRTKDRDVNHIPIKPAGDQRIAIRQLPSARRMTPGPEHSLASASVA